ncbi:hypothetical protein [Nocardia noduli]|uniref:hypothetical protein n=1 Tax=Nocardia noduli TaxID=2815722 RepID=UPI001C233A48|nr:hypothetical protein [Nocardia noduli]
MKITAARADELLGSSWFSDYTAEVDLHEEPVVHDEFDVEARCEALEDTESVLFGAGLTVHGTLDLAVDVHSIYAVRGTLRARRLILGDAVLVVDGTVEVDEWLFGGDTRGVFEVGGLQVESEEGHDALFAKVATPTAVLLDRARGELVLRQNGEPRQTGHLVAPALDDLDPDYRPELLIGARLRELLIAGRPIFA